MYADANGNAKRLRVCGSLCVSYAVRIPAFRSATKEEWKMVESNGAQGARSADKVRVDLLRLKAGTNVSVRSLADRYGGCLVHWEKGRNRYHPREGCRWCSGKGETTWKGYFAAEYWSLQRGVWLPTVAELTEAGELDVRGSFGRGVVLRFWREKQLDAKEPRQNVAVIERLEPSSLRPPFDIRPILRTIYHVDEILLDVDNPAADRVFLEPVADAPPGSTLPREKTPAELAQDYAKLTGGRPLRDLLDGIGKMPVENGSQKKRDG